METTEFLLRPLDKIHKPKTIIKLVRAQHRLEKRKLNAEERKAWLELGKSLLDAGGKSLQGLLSNQVAGTAFFIAAATALYPAWFPLFRFATASIAADIGAAWKAGIIPPISFIGKGSVTPPPQPPPGPEPVTTTIWFVEHSGQKTIYFDNELNARSYYDAQLASGLGLLRTTLKREMRRDGVSLGVVTLAEGGFL